MGMGGEKYSKEALDEAIKKENEILETPSVRVDYYENIAASERVDKLFKTAKKEATGINQEYDKKMEKFREEITIFSKFAINELGMDEAQLKEVFKDTVDGVFEQEYPNLKSADSKQEELE